MEKATGIEVRELFRFDFLEEKNLVSGSNGLDRQITKINVMEVPDIINWVTPGEFLLTTAYSLKDDMEKLKNLIPMLNEKGLAGLGIKTKRYIDEIPQDIINVANELGFPIIEIPINVSYSEIITKVLLEINNKQTYILTAIDRFHDRLLAIMLKGGSLFEIAEAIHVSIGNSVAISEDIYKTEAIVCNGKANDFKNVLAEFKNKNPLNYTCKVDTYDKTFANDIIGGCEVKRIDIPICIENEHYGFIHIWEDKKSLSLTELSVIESSMSLIALDIVKKLSITEIENKHRIEFFDNLLSKDKKNHQKALERANLFNFDEKLVYAVVLIKFNNIHEIVNFTHNNSDYIHKLHGKLTNIIEKITRLNNYNVLYANKSDRFIILFGSNRNTEDYKKEVIEFSNSIHAYTKNAGINSNISIGIGRTYEKTNELWSSYRESTRASDNSMENINNTPVHYDDLGIYRILSYEELQPELHKFYDEILGSLVEYDKEKDSELIETLKTYFHCGGNLKKISKEMYIHYNTIIYRIQRIKEILGIDFDNHENMLNLQICLKVYDILNNNKK